MKTETIMSVCYFKHSPPKTGVYLLSEHAHIMLCKEHSICGECKVSKAEIIPHQNSNLGMFSPDTLCGSCYEKLRVERRKKGVIGS